MFGLFTRSRNQKKARKTTSPRRQVHLSLEGLETRDCPSAPSLMFGWQVISNHRVELQGSVYDDHPASVVVNFSGAASGTATVNSSGYFDYITSSATLGTVHAQAVNDQGLSSMVQSSDISVANPTISYMLMSGSQRTVTLSGSVSDADKGGIAVTFGGVLACTIPADANGNFNVTTQASGLGSFTITVVNSWGKTGSAQGTLTSSPPTISNFTATSLGSGIWVFAGHVNDASAQGETVAFSGLPSLQGKVATVDQNGDFTLTVQLQPGEDGTATAQDTNWWGQTSNTAWNLV